MGATPVFKDKAAAPSRDNLESSDDETSNPTFSPFDSMRGKHDDEFIEDVGSGSLANDDSIQSFLGLKGQSLNVAISVIAGTGFLLFGYDQGVMGSLLTLPSFYGTFEDMNTTTTTGALKSKNSTWQGFVIAVYEVGCLVGALATMYIGDKLGRRRTIFVGCIIMIIGAVIQAASFSSGQLIAARIITGIGNGMNTSTVPVWQSECAKPNRRGPLVMLGGALITCGIMISYWIDFAFYFIPKSSVSWRFPIAFQLIFPLVILPFILKLPESPRWLIKKDRLQDAARAFSGLDNLPKNSSVIQQQIEDILTSLSMERKSNGKIGTGIKAMFKQGKQKNFQRAMLAIWIQIMQQITGINLITYYAGTVFQDYIHMTPLNSRILAACNGTEYFMASWIAYFCIEKFGRRRLILFAAGGQAITMGILTGTTWASENNNNSGAAIAAAVFLFVFNTFFAIGWLGMAWLVAAEITPLSIRAPANGFSTACNWSFNFMVVMITPVAFDSIGPYTYTIFAAINALIVPVIYFLYPETVGTTLEDVDVIFENSSPKKPWDAVRVAKKMSKHRRNSELADPENVSAGDRISF